MPAEGFDSLRALIQHQLSALGDGVARLTALLSDIRVENAKRDKTDETHTRDIAKLREDLESLVSTIKSEVDRLEGKVAPLTAVNAASKPLITIAKWVLPGLGSFVLGALAHYLYGGH